MTADGVQQKDGAVSFKSAAVILGVALLLLGLVRLTWNIATDWFYTPDDTYITFRYSWNLVHGRGPIYTAGAPHSEGCTTFLWLLLMAIPHLLSLDPLLFSKLFGTLLTYATAALIFIGAYRLAPTETRNDIRVLCASVGVFAFACYVPTAAHAVSGMETALHAFLATLFFLLIASVKELSVKRIAAIPITALLLCLNRPDGVLIAGVCLAWCVLSTEGGLRRALLRACLLWLILPGALFMGWRVWFYQHLLPLPFYIKYGGAAAPGLEYMTRFLDLLFAVIGVPLALLVTRRDVLVRVVPILISVALFILFYCHVAPIMNFNWRFTYPMVPILFALAGAGLGSLASHRPRKLSARALGLAAMTAASLGALFTFAQFNAGRKIDLEKKRSYASGLSAAHIRLGGQLSKMDPQTLLAMGDAGAAAYLGKCRAIDTLGLNDAHIALNGHDPKYILDQHPSFIVVVSQSATNFVVVPEIGYEEQLYQKSIGAGYRLCEVLTFDHGYHLWVLSNTPATGEQLRGG